MRRFGPALLGGLLASLTLAGCGDADGPASAEDLATLRDLRAEVAAKNTLLKGLIDRLRGIQATIDDTLEDGEGGGAAAN